MAFVPTNACTVAPLFLFLETVMLVVSEQLADIAHLFVVNFKLQADVTYDDAIGRAVANVDASDPVKLILPLGKVKLNAVVTRKANLTISTYDTVFVPTNNTSFVWTHYGDYFTVEDCEVEGETVDTFRGFKVLNDATTKLSSYAFFKDVNLVDIYQALDFYNESGLGGACYRHKFSNVRIRNYTQTKDGGGIAFELDGGSFLSLNQCYVEYNDTFIKALNNPYRPV